MSVFSELLCNTHKGKYKWLW